MKVKESISSKKLWFAVGSVLIAFVYAVLAASKLPELKGMYDTFTSVLEFIAAAYLTGNIANKWVVGRVENGQPVVPLPQKAPAKTETKKQALQGDPLDKDLPGGGV